ncbi:MAG TPA: phospholipase D-like domain-containing protein [Polyangia bacterium]
MRPILKAGRNLWRTTHADQTKILVDAADYYRAFYAAAEHAQHYILVSGWQFDRGVKLLRGTHAVGRGKLVRLVKFLDNLCKRTPTLRIYMLAWDFHMVFALEREWMQRLWFHYATNKRLIFRFDEAKASQGCHHQKFAVIDGKESFLGGIDLCESRWDDREHRTENPLRLTRGRPSKPYHDVQAQLTGRGPGAILRELFVDRWERSGGDPLVLTDPEVALPPLTPLEPAPPESIVMGARPVAISRTDPRGKSETIKEIEHLFVDAIAAADRLIFVETQYFSSTCVRNALIARMKARHRPKLEIVVILNERAEALKEELAVGLRQAKNLVRLRRTAAATGHKIGFFYSLSAGAGKAQRATYIHSKLMAVDDRFLTVGSANLTNRSMEVDSELHVSWEAEPDDAWLMRQIRRVRVSLLAEHGGFHGTSAVRCLVKVEGLVDCLTRLASDPNGRLRVIGPPTPAQQKAMGMVDPENLPFDPQRAEYVDGPAQTDDEDFTWAHEPSEEMPRLLRRR